MTAGAAAQPALFTTPAIPTTRGTRGTPSTPGNHLTQHLIRAGHLTETGLTRRATIRTCPTCHQATITGLDGDTLALEATTDPHPLNPLGEALAHLDNRATWSLHREGPRYVLDPRDHHDITHHPAGTRPRDDTLRQHRCHTPPPADALTTPSTLTPPATSTLPPGAPAPF